MDEDKRIIRKRICAYLFDIVFLLFVISLITNIRIINPHYEKYMEYYEKNNNILKDYESNKITLEEYSELYSENYYYISKYTTSYSIVIIVCELLYFGVFQKYNNGQTLGKKIMRIKVVDNNDKGNVGVLRYFLRTIAIFFIYIGSVISLSINTILVFLIKLNYSSISMIVNYVFLFISLVSLIFILIRKDRRGIQDLLTNTKVVFEKK